MSQWLHSYSIERTEQDTEHSKAGDTECKIIMEYCDKGSLLKAIQKGLFHSQVAELGLGDVYGDVYGC